jgi:adenylate cyclase
VDEANRTRIALHIVETLYALAVAAWLALPLAEAAGLLPTSLGAGWGAAAAVATIGALAWPLAAVAVVLFLAKLAALPLARIRPAFFDPTRPLPICTNFALSAGVIALLVVSTLHDAASGRYFAALPLPQYGAFGISLAWNATSIGVLLGSLNRRDPLYREYLQFRREGGGRVAIAGLTPHGIQQRLALTYIPLILAIIVVLSWVLMRDYSRTLLGAVIDGGLSLAERTAGIVKANADDLIAVEDVLAGEAARNRNASLPFGAISLYWKAPRGGSVSVPVSTDPAREDTSAQAADEPAATDYRLLEDGSIYEFRSPVVLGGTSLGWVGVEYARDVVYEPVFRSQVKVSLIAALFVYASVFLTWVFGQAVVFPILYLRMSVSRIASALQDMISGRLRVSPERLQYRDLVKTRDEIRGLSGEIGHMTTVIRGVLPYISTSTLRHAAGETAKARKVDLVYLFTDIRGFTTFCEGRPPEGILTMLNRYLDLQASVIASHGGDIDKYVGDEVFARFEGAKKELRACTAALAIRAAVREEQQKARGAGEEPISIGIGINSGHAVFGPVGTGDRKDFTAIGDEVNLAARLEGANKIYGTRTLVSESIARNVAAAFLMREIDLLTVKGKHQPVRIYELLQRRTRAEPKIVELARVFGLGLRAYRRQQWPAAEKAFSYLAAKYKDEPSRVFLRRVASFSSRPPGEDWDGVFNLTVK